jgi:hypothetical protein
MLQQSMVIMDDDEEDQQNIEALFDLPSDAFDNPVCGTQDRLLGTCIMLSLCLEMALLKILVTRLAGPRGRSD